MKSKLLTNSINFLRKNMFVMIFFMTAVSMNSQVLIPYSGSLSVPCGSNVVLQAHNGSTGQYSNNANGYVVLDAGFQAVINIVGTYTTEANFDYIRIYDGVGINGTLLQTYHGQNMAFNFTSAPGQTITVRFSSDGSVVYAGFNLNVTYSGACFATPCSGTPFTNTIIGGPLSICPGQNSTLLLDSAYQVGGITYQWQSSTVSPVGPYTAVTNATNNAVVTSTLGVTTWYQAVVTCTNSSMSSTTTGQQIIVEGTTTNNVPYFEGFEGITVPNRLPNCSWSASNLGGTVKTYTASNSGNRLPRNGNNFATFEVPSTNNTIYTNGINMVSGITYSAAIHYATEYFGYSNWSNLTILVGPNQSTTGLVQVATVGPVISGSYKLLSGTFTVPTSGLYYVAFRANGLAGNAQYLSLDDISVTIPCTQASGNTPTVSLNVNDTIVCSGAQVSLNAAGADTFTWNTGATGNQLVVTATSSFTYEVTGTSALTGCTESRSQYIQVNASPTVFVIASTPEVCAGETVYLTAYGASSYAWNHGPAMNVVAVNPVTTTSYNVVGMSPEGCSANATQVVSVRPLPSISVSSPGEICAGEAVSLTGLGGASYIWYSSSSQSVLNGPMIVVSPAVPTTYTVIGTGTNNCVNTATVMQGVQACVGINEFTSAGGIQVYPNPSTDKIFVESSLNVSLVEITDLTGRIVLSAEASSTKVEIDLSNLTNSVYLMKIYSGDSVKTLRVIKN